MITPASPSWSLLLLSKAGFNSPTFNSGIEPYLKFMPGVKCESVTDILAVATRLALDSAPEVRILALDPDALNSHAFAALPVIQKYISLVICVLDFQPQHPKLLLALSRGIAPASRTLTLQHLWAKVPPKAPHPQPIAHATPAPVSAPPPSVSPPPLRDPQTKDQDLVKNSPICENSSSKFITPSYDDVIGNDPLLTEEEIRALLGPA